MSAVRPILVTGFEPFDGHELNVSWELARALHGQAVGKTRWVAEQMPCSFGAWVQGLGDAIDRHGPCAVVCLGQAEGRSAISLERVAINVRDARIPDNNGHQPTDQAVVVEGPFAYPTRLPIRQMVSQLTSQGHKVEISNSAGTFVCNDFFYGLMHITRNSTIPAGFIHLPILPEQSRHHAQRSASRDDAPIGYGETPTLGLQAQLTALTDIGALLAPRH
jgi:pyroglutamyl-peptidase